MEDQQKSLLLSRKWIQSLVLFWLLEHLWIRKRGMFAPQNTPCTSCLCTPEFKAWVNTWAYLYKLLQASEDSPGIGLLTYQVFVQKVSANMVVSSQTTWSVLTALWTICIYLCVLNPCDKWTALTQFWLKASFFCTNKHNHSRTNTGTYGQFSEVNDLAVERPRKPKHRQN